MESNNNTSHLDQRLQLFEDTDVLRHIDASEAKRLSPKAKDCQRQLNEATSVWAIDGKKFLFVFAKKTEGDQKVTVWGVKKPGEYQRIKTVFVANDDDIFEAIPVFLTEYFDLKLGGMGYRVDEDWYLDIQDELADLVRHCPVNLKPKMKLLRIWNEIIPRLSEEVWRIGQEDAEAPRPPKGGESEETQGEIEVTEERDVFVERPLTTKFQLEEFPEKIVDSIDPDKDCDLDLLFAALAYDIAVLTELTKSGSRSEWEKRESRTIAYSENIFKDVNPDAIDENALFRVNALALEAAYDRHMKYEQLEKAIGKMFRSVLQVAIKQKLPLSLPYLELLVNTRRFNKRLPKHLSNHIREILDHRVHVKSGFWNQFKECSSLEGRLRMTWIQCMSLRLYGYDPNESYTRDQICDLMPEMLRKMEPDAVLLYSRICHDCKFDSVQLKHFDETALKKAATLTDSASILKLHAACILYRSTAKQLVPLEVGTHGPNVSPASPSQDAQRLTLDAHKDWFPHVEHFLNLHEKGVSLRDFCLVKDLPCEEFLEFFNSAMAQMKEFYESDPVLRKIAALPKEYQEEYSSLMRRQGEIMPEICECMSTLIGEKIEVEDIKNNPDILEPKVMEMMKRINSFEVEDTATSIRFLAAYSELGGLDKEIEAFHRRHHL